MKKQKEVGDVPKLEVEVIETPIPIAKIIELRNKRLSYHEIAVIVGCSEQNIHQRLKPFRKSIDHLEAVKESRADTLAVISDTILNSLTMDDINRASLLQRTTAFSQLFDKERLERGKSTSNIAYADMTRNLSEMDQEIAALEAELGEVGEDDDK